MKFNWNKIISVILFFAVGFVIWFLIMFSVYRIAKNRREQRQEFLRESYSPMSVDPEVQEAYDVIRNQNK